MNFGQLPAPQPNVQEVIQRMGKTYVCHPANQVKRKTPFRRTARSLRAALGSGRSV